MGRARFSVDVPLGTSNVTPPRIAFLNGDLNDGLFGKRWLI